MGNNQNRIETEKPIKLASGHWRIIDILVNDYTCIEIGNCREEKVVDLENNGYEVVRFPYSYFEGEI
jgi:hypothetical protein